MMRLAKQTLGLAMLAALLGSTAGADAPHLSAEQRTAAAMEKARATTPQLRMFLQAMPKGGDIHNHAPGAVYAEDQIEWAARLEMCASDTANRLSPPPCTSGQTPVQDILKDYPRYSRLIDTLSVRGIEQGIGDPFIPGYDRFFFAIDYAGAPLDPGKSFAIAREAASYDNIQYLELMTGGGKGQRQLMELAASSGLDGTDFAALDRIFQPSLATLLAQSSAQFDDFEAEGRRLLGCDSDHPAPACTVDVLYLSVGFRTPQPAIVYASLAFSFALAQADERFVGVNLVGPEHDPVARRDYSLHMRMVRHLHELYPAVPISLHAGELTIGVVPPRDLRSHIAEAIDIDGVKRIGHGMDVAMERDGRATLKHMADERIALEVNLTSNAIILGVKGKDHPLALYREAGVPVVLGTDDEGLTRGDMTNEFMRAVQEQALDYLALKEIVRNSLEYAFIPGASLWRSEVGGEWAIPCKSSAERPTRACAAFLKQSARATQQYELERKLAAFEASHP